MGCCGSSAKLSTPIDIAKAGLGAILAVRVDAMLPGLPDYLETAVTTPAEEYSKMNPAEKLAGSVVTCSISELAATMAQANEKLGDCERGAALLMLRIEKVEPIGDSCWRRLYCAITKVEPPEIMPKKVKPSEPVVNAPGAPTPTLKDPIQMKAMLLGLNNSGKSTLLDNLDEQSSSKHKKKKTKKSRAKSEAHSFCHNGEVLFEFDPVGSVELLEEKEISRHQGTECLFFVIDGTDRMRLRIAKEMLLLALSQCLPSAPLCIFLTKMDVAQALSQYDVSTELQLSLLYPRECHIQECVPIHGSGTLNGIEWMAKTTVVRNKIQLQKEQILKSEPPNQISAPQETCMPTTFTQPPSLAPQQQPRTCEYSDRYTTNYVGY